jgi:hypothetical protein
MPELRNNAFPHVKPSFQISASSSVFTIGSCFARNVEAVLVKMGVAVPSYDFSVPEGEVAGVKNRALNQYNTGTMADILHMTLVENEIHGGLFEVSDGLFGDSLLSGTFENPVPLNRARERRADVLKLYREGLAKSDTVVITLGLSECWYDLEDKVYLNALPTMRILRKFPDRFEFRTLGVKSSYEKVCEIVEHLNRDRKRNIVLTVSPVPLVSTFSSQDAVSANGASKAILRVVAEEIVSNYDNVDYFPSYEMVTSAGFSSYKDDLIHVDGQVVSRIVKFMAGLYVASVDTPMVSHPGR